MPIHPSGVWKRSNHRASEKRPSVKKNDFVKNFSALKNVARSRGTIVLKYCGGAPPETRVPNWCSPVSRSSYLLLCSSDNAKTLQILLHLTLSPPRRAVKQQPNFAPRGPCSSIRRPDRHAAPRCIASTSVLRTGVFPGLDRSFDSGRRERYFDRRPAAHLFAIEGCGIFFASLIRRPAPAGQYKNGSATLLEP